MGWFLCQIRPTFCRVRQQHLVVSSLCRSIQLDILTTESRVKSATLKKPALATAEDVNPGTFAEVLRQLMIDKRVSASELARRVWGTLQDGRGYTVARNRDRIGHYLSGRSYPEKENLDKIAKALGVSSDVFSKLQPAPVVRAAKEPNAIEVILYPDDAVSTGHVSMNKLKLTAKTITAIIELIGKDTIHIQSVKATKAKK